MSVAVTSITTLSVYLVPLIGLLLSFDAIAGEIERGTLALSLAYPLSRAEILIGKFLSAFFGVGFLLLGYGLALSAVLVVWQHGADDLSFMPHGNFVFNFACLGRDIFRHWLWGFGSGSPT